MSERFDSKKGDVFPFSPTRSTSRPVPIVSFDRKELALILNVYGRKVAAGEWRDYALDFGRERAMFRSTSAPRNDRFSLSRKIRNSHAAKGNTWWLVATGACSSAAMSFQACCAYSIHNFTWFARASR